MCVVLAATSSLAFAGVDDQEQGWLGIYLGEVPESAVSHLNREDVAKGIIVLKVIEDSPAQEAGLQQHDIMLKFGDQEFEGVAGFVELIRSSLPDDKVNLFIVRSGQEQTISAVLGIRPPMNSVIMKDIYEDVDFNFGLGGKGKHLKIGGIHLHEIGEGEGLHGKLTELIGDFEDGTISVKVECEDGEGTVTIEREGEVTTETFDCSDMEGKGARRRHVIAISPGAIDIELPEIPDLDIEIPEIDLDLDLSDIPRFIHKVQGVCVKQEATRKFRIENGQIEVVIRKGENELTEVFASEEELKAQKPELYQAYLELKEEMND